MRWFFSLSLLVAAQIGAAWAGAEINVARPGGVFSIVQSEDAASCERSCADDGLCMAWSYRDGACELKAVVPAPITQFGTVSGISARAPASLRTATPRAPETVLSDPGPGLTAPLETDAPPLLARAEDDVSSLLLGGLNEEESLRARLGN
jgi:hypothetical protein